MSEKEVRAAAELFKKRGLDAVIVGFLFSFLNDAHEKRAVEIVKEVMPDAFVCASSEVVNVIREYHPPPMTNQKEWLPVYCRCASRQVLSPAT